MWVCGEDTGMAPKLIALCGPRKRGTIEIIGNEVTIGREESNTLSLNDSSVSRHHCRIQVREGEVAIEDIDSLNGTFVNQAPVHHRVLMQDDIITIGSSQFLFLLHEVQKEHVSTSLLTPPSGGVSHTTIRLNVDESHYLLPEKMPSSAFTPRRSAAMQALLRISEAVHVVQSFQAMASKLLELSLQTLVAERGAVFMIASLSGEWEPICALDRKQGNPEKFEVNRELLQTVLQSGEATLTDERILCVPILFSGTTAGALYLDADDPRIKLDEEDLQIAAAIARIGSIALENIRRTEALRAETDRLRKSIEIEHNMIGESNAMAEVYKMVARVSPSDATVLIYGESGTGKELAAHALHQNSPRREKPFIAVNCAALNENLLESELFGHERGAFTGAIAQKKGKLEVAHGGSILLDEIGELPLALQAKLLRVLQEREFERVGGTKTLHVDIRLMAATNRNLPQLVTEGKFRQDLFYRLNVIAITMPPLRDRREDIPLLAMHFAAKYASKTGRRVSGIPPETRAALNRYDWPGNVRELENAIERAVVLGTEDRILPEDLPDAILESGDIQDRTKYHDAVLEAKRQIVQKALERHGGNYTEAARSLGLHPNNLYRLVRTLGKPQP